MEPSKTYNWSQFEKTPIYKKILDEWKQMLDDVTLKEQDYHAYLQRHPSVFLTNARSYIAISKLNLGTDYQTDFVVPHEGYSEGTKYEMIEIETPHTELFTRKGLPTEKFNSALQQIRDWKRWLIENRYPFSKQLPSTNTKVLKDSNLRFKIVIGRRTENQQHLEKRDQIALQEGVEIISFDRLTDMAERWSIYSDTTRIVSAQMDFGVPYWKNNALANPFFTCTSDADWRKICRKGGAHFHTSLIDEILRYRSYNNYFEEFKALKEGVE